MTELEKTQIEENPLKKDPDWEHALHIFENVITHKSEKSQVKAILKLARFSNHIPRHAFSRIIPILVENLRKPSQESNSNPSIHEATAYCLKRIAFQGNEVLLEIIGQSDVISSLLRLLPNSSGRFRQILVKCLWASVSHCTANRGIFVRGGGLEVVIRMLALGEESTLRKYLLEILSALALLREVRRVLISVGGVRFLVESALFGNIESRARAAQAIGLLGVTRRARGMLVELGVIPVLVELLRDGDDKTKIVAGNALGVVSCHVGYIRPVAQAGAIDLYAQLLEGADPMGREIAEDAFCVLAIAEENVVDIIDHLVRILAEGDDDARSAAADVLWDLSGYEHAVCALRNAGAIPLMVELLTEGSSDVVEKVSGAIAQLSYDAENRELLSDEGAIPILITMLQNESEEIRDNAAEALINFSEDPLLHDMVATVLDNPLFQEMQSRMDQLHASNEHMARSLRQMSMEALTWNPNLD
ncbi:hypothetical protein RJ641_000511 [Dillenia turbinata]|uniref:Uncharacterized protein n=1 Tax=Dillenia turbinata TaxID=194707 RepID=A0AAN8WI95_9MAGN